MTTTNIITRAIMMKAKEDDSRRYFNSVSIYEHAVKFHRIPTYDCRISGRKPEKRGSINCFSRHSRLRLREAIAKAKIKNSCTYGLTLTLPWQDYNKNKFVKSFYNYDEKFFTLKYRECFNRFTLNFRRTFPNSGCIFRHELQKRKMPHCHLIVWFSNLDISFDSSIIKSAVFPLWLKSLNNDFFGGDKMSFFKYGLKVEKLDNCLALFRYLADHTSKSKQAQLGYIGKHWGYINRKVFQVQNIGQVDFVDYQSRVFFSRHISSLCRYSVSYERYKQIKKENGRSASRKFPFGSVKIHSSKVSGFKFVSFKSIQPLLIYMYRNGKIHYPSHVF